MARELQALKKRVGARLRQRRQDLEQSQEHVAFQAAISPTYLSQIEAGARNPSLKTLFQLCVALDMDLPDLLKS
jgi:transcriptional regulator with XRE-family HTH domain